MQWLQFSDSVNAFRSKQGCPNQNDVTIMCQLQEKP